MWSNEELTESMANQLTSEDRTGSVPWTNPDDCSAVAGAAVANAAFVRS